MSRIMRCYNIYQNYFVAQPSLFKSVILALSIYQCHVLCIFYAYSGNHNINRKCIALDVRAAKNMRGAKESELNNGPR